MSNGVHLLIYVFVGLVTAQTVRREVRRIVEAAEPELHGFERELAQRRDDYVEGRLTVEQFEAVADDLLRMIEAEDGYGVGPPDPGRAIRV